MEKRLIKFGNYLLSKERKKSISKEVRGMVNDVDLDKFYEQEKQENPFYLSEWGYMRATIDGVEHVFDGVWQKASEKSEKEITAALQPGAKAITEEGFEYIYDGNGWISSADYHLAAGHILYNDEWITEEAYNKIHFKNLTKKICDVLGLRKKVFKKQDISVPYDDYFNIHTYYQHIVKNDHSSPYPVVMEISIYNDIQEWKRLKEKLKK